MDYDIKQEQKEQSEVRTVTNINHRMMRLEKELIRIYKEIQERLAKLFADKSLSPAKLDEEVAKIRREAAIELDCKKDFDLIKNDTLTHIKSDYSRKIIAEEVNKTEKIFNSIKEVTLSTR